MVEGKHTRRRFLRGAGAAALAGFAGVAGYASLWEPYAYEVTETDVFIRGLPAGFDGLRVAQLTDVHHSPLVPIGEVRRVVELANAARPDLFVLTGDYTTSRRRYIEPCAEALGRLSAPGGVWAVLGNHDHYNDAELTTRALERRGISVLSNANTLLRRGGDELRLAGVDDWGWGQADWGRTLRGVDLSRPSVLLSHEPAVLDMPEAAGLSLIVSGHTHGGQISLPFVGAPARFVEEFRYLGGLYERGGTQLYVSRGTGMIGLPVRLGARPEIAVLRLRTRPESQTPST
ncbi:MAG TPA: metallophosphoesterase [Pyrinomonadaceae bacterium]|nr:metallophosphoesterase [Pyrinomonadaceae bacterium]